jgi:hypothetical protein
LLKTSRSGARLSSTDEASASALLEGDVDLVGLMHRELEIGGGLQDLVENVDELPLELCSPFLLLPVCSRGEVKVCVLDGCFVLPDLPIFPAEEG